MSQHEPDGYIDAQRLHQRLVDYIRIPSVTGQEDAAIARLAEWLREAGAEVDHWSDGIGTLQMDPEYPGHEVERAWVPVVAGVVRGTRPGPTVLLTGHVDVVPPGDYAQWSRDPYSGFTEGDLVYGRGASDMKSGVIAALEAFEAFLRGPRDFPGRVIFVGVPAEEDSGLGTLAAIRRGYGGDAAIVPEPTADRDSPSIIVAHTGAVSLLIEVKGLAAHASKRLSGESALDHYWAVHQALKRDEQIINDAEDHPLMRELTLPYATNVGLINGGEWSSTVMDRLRLEVRVGVPLGQTVREAEERVRRAIAEETAKVPWLAENPPTVTRIAAGFGAAETDSDDPLVTTLADVAERRFDDRPDIKAAPYGCDMAAWVSLAGVPTVLYGPGDIEWAHAADEHVSITTTRGVAEVLTETTDSLLRQGLHSPGGQRIRRR